MYDCDCEDCKTLASENKPKKGILNAAEKAFKRLHETGGYSPNDLVGFTEYVKLIQATTGVFEEALSSGIVEQIPDEMLRALKQDVYLFSALRTHSQLWEASRALLDDNGQVKPFSKFRQDIEAIHENYNVNYLDAEYNFAVASAQQAANWVDVEKDGDKYNLEYRTAADDKVRESHQALQGITLPPSDAFWAEYYPPNGWRCRCKAVQVAKEPDNESDSKKAIEAGKKATTQIGANGKNKLEIFRFNPGKQKVIFPPGHPYNRVSGAAKVKKLLQDRYQTVDDLNKWLDGYAKSNPEMFARGFKSLQTTRRKGVNGYTDLNGNIHLTSDRMNSCKDALNAIERNQLTTYAQEDALSTLHHEIWHNANKVGMSYLSTYQTQTMELANEYVSRKTLPQFMEAIGGKLNNKSLISDRPSTGYNQWVKNYEILTKWAKCDEGKVLDSVKDYLINGSYKTQITGLVNAIRKTSSYQLSDQDVKELVNVCLRARDTETFVSYLKKYENLLVEP